MPVEQDQPVPRPGSGTPDRASLIAVLRRRALIILLTAILCGAAAAAFAYANRDSYESTAKLLFDQTIGAELNAVGILPVAQDADNLAENNAEFADSRRVAVATAEALRAEGVDVSIDEIDEDVQVTRVKDTEVVDVVASAESPAAAAQLANAYANSVQRLTEEDLRERAERVLRSVEGQLAELSPSDRRGRLGNRLRADAERLRTLSEAGSGSPEIIQPGYPPTSKSGDPLQTIVLGLLFGVLLGIGLALLREQADRRLHHAEDVSAAFHAPVIATVPRDRALKRNTPFADLPPAASEAFRLLQMNLRFGDSGPVRSVVVTSSRSGEGKTTVAWNLAVAAASAGLSVAFVEADMRRPAVAQRYGLTTGPGLSEALQDHAAVSPLLQPVQPLPGVAGMNGQSRALHVLVAGQAPSHPWALMQSPALVHALDELQREHDLVVIDTPPISHVADAISLLRRVDGVIVVVSVNSTSGAEAGRLRHQLESLKARVLGVVANGGSAGAGYAYSPPAGVAAPGAESRQP